MATQHHGAGQGRLLGVIGNITIGIDIDIEIETAGTGIAGIGITIGTSAAFVEAKFQVYKICKAMNLICWVRIKYNSMKLAILLIPIWPAPAISHIYMLNQPFHVKKYFSHSELRFEST